MKIPQFFSEAIPEVPRTSPSIAAMPYEERARLGDTLTNLSQRLLETNLRLAKEKQEREFNQSRMDDLNDYELFMAEKQIEEQQRPDKTGYLERMKQYSLEKQAELLKKYKDPEQLEIVKAKLKDAHIRNLLKASAQDRIYYIDREKGRIKANVYKFEKRIEGASDEEERRAILNEALSYLDTLGDIDRDWTEGLKIGLQEFTKKRQEEVNLNNALAEIETGKFTQDEVTKIIEKYKIPADKQPSLRRHAKVVENDHRIETDRKMSLNLVDDVTKQFAEFKSIPEVYLKMVRDKLENPDYLKEKGATLDHARAALNFIQQGYKTAQELEWNSTQNYFLKKLEEGTLTKAEVLASNLPATGLMQGDQAWFINEINKRAKNIDPYLHSNPKTFSDAFVDIIRNPKNWTREKILSLVAKTSPDGNIVGVTVGDAYKLIKLLDDQQSPAPDLAKKYQPLQLAAQRLEEYRKNFMFVIPKEVDSKGNPIITKDDLLLNDKLHYEALQQLQADFEAGKDPMDSIQQIMKRYVLEKQKTFFDKILEWSKTPPAFRILEHILKPPEIEQEKK